MKIQFLGTAAAEGVPAFFCDCDVCNYSRKMGGRNIRSRSQAIIDDKILIDFCPDTLWHMNAFGINLNRVHTCLLTHAHSDHINADELVMRQRGFSNLKNPEKFVVYGSRASLVKLNEIIFKRGIHEDVGAEIVSSRNPFTVEGYTVTPLRAIHAPELDPLIYMIQKDGKTFIYGTDTGIFVDEVMDYLADNKIYVDAVAMDCTEILNDCQYPYHMDFGKNVKLKGMLMDRGICDENTKFICHHFSHNAKASYDDFVPIAAKEGFDVTYDGMILEI